MSEIDCHICLKRHADGLRHDRNGNLEPAPMTHSDTAGLVAELREGAALLTRLDGDRDEENTAQITCAMSSAICDLFKRAADTLEALSTPQAQVTVDAQALHRVWAETLRDPEVTPSQLIIEFGRRCAALTQPATGK